MIIRAISVSERKVNFPFLNFQNILYMLILKSQFEKIRTANLHCHWIKSPWRRVEKGVCCFLNKTSWRHLAIRLEDVLEEEKLLRWRRLQDGLKICLEDVLKTCHEASWRHILKTSLRSVLKTSSRRLGDKQNVYWGYLYLTNLNVYHFTNLYLTNLRWIQNALFRTQQFR